MKFNTKINRFKVERKFLEESIIFFDSVDNYYLLVKKYIYTNIDILKAKKYSQEFFQARTQISLSSALLRSIYLNEAAITQLNANNLVGLFGILKSFLEIPAYLGYILHILNKKTSNEERLKLFAHLHLGNRGEGELTVGDLEIPNILTMFDKTEKEINKIFNNKDTSKNIGNIAREFYELVCNFSHPNYNAHALIGTIEDEGEYNLFPIGNLENLKRKEFNGYKPPWNTAILAIEMLSHLIINHPTIKNFSKTQNKKYFS